MKDLNLCQFIGRLGNDPDVRMTQSGTTTAGFNLACSDDYTDKTSGQKVEQSNWIRCVAFGRLAEIIRDYTKKGSKIYVSGKQSTRKWVNQAGVEQYITEITINEMQMLDAKPEAQQQRPQQKQQQRPQYSAPMPQDDFNDVPF